MQFQRYGILAFVGVVTAALFLSTAAPSFGVSASPEVKERLRKAGATAELQRLLNVEHLEALISSEGADPSKGYRLRPSTLAGITATDTIRVLFVLVDFPDRPASAGAVTTPTMFDSLLLSTGHKNPTGSYTEFYMENTNGKLFIKGDVIGWYRMDSTNAYYCNGASGLAPNGRARQLARDVALKVDPDVDFTLYDNDGNGTVDGFYVVHAGIGAEETGSGNDLWSHVSNISPSVPVDGKTVSRYTVCPEENSGNRMVAIGVFCHESGHLLFFLPDLYVDSNPGGEGVGEWSLMGSCNWLNNSKTPCHMDPWCKFQRRWAEIETVTTNQNAVSIPKTVGTNKAYRLWTNGSLGTSYFYVENRRRTGFDAALNGEGLLIWQINESQSQGNNPPKVDLLQADGLRNLENGNNRGDAGDPFPGTSNNRNFDEFSNPNSKNPFNQAATQVAVFNIGNGGLDTMTANFEVTYGRPHLSIDSTWFDDAATGNNNGKIDSAETVRFYVRLKNAWANASNVTVLLRADDPRIVFADSTALLASVPGLGATTTSLSDPIEFTADPSLPNSYTIFFTVLAWNNDSSATVQQTFKATVGPTTILLVDDDGGTNNWESFYTTTLDSVRKPFGSHTVLTGGIPSIPTLSSYPTVIWFTGNNRTPTTLTSTAVANLKAYLDGGGKLFITGQSIGEALAASADSSFLINYLHCRYGGNTFTIRANGVTGDPISNALDVYILGADGAANQTSADWLKLQPGADSIFTYLSNSKPAGVRVIKDTTYKLVYLGFGFEGISSTRVGFATRQDVMTKVLNWLNAPYPVIILGDFDNSGVVDITDIVGTVAYVVFGTPGPVNGQASIDVNCDGVIDLVDIVAMIQNVVFSLPFSCP